MLLTAGMAESKRVPFDLPEGESELIAGYFTEYSGGKQAVFMMTDFAEIVLVSVLIATVFFRRMAGAVALSRRLSFSRRRPSWACRNLSWWRSSASSPSWVKVVVFCWLQILIRWTLPRFRYDQLMRLGWKGLVPLGLANVVVTACRGGGRRER